MVLQGAMRNTGFSRGVEMNELSDRTSRPNSSGTTFSGNMASGRFENLSFGPLSQLPKDWRLLTGLDAIVIPQSELGLLARKYPHRLAAIRKWVTAGGRLILSDAGSDWKSLRSVARNIGAGNESGFQARNWDWKFFKRTKVRSLKEIRKQVLAREVEREDYDENLYSTFDSSQRESSQGFARRENNLKASGANFEEEAGVFRLGQQPPIDAQGRPVSVLYRGYGAGKIVAVSKHEKDWTTVDWILVETASGKSEVQAMVGQDFVERSVPSGFAIQKAGEPPVVLFVFLILAFAVVVGPVFYYTLNRYRRVQWLVFVIPVFSLMVSATLLLYTLAKDGIGLQSKRISVTFLDQPSGVALTQTVQTVFQGVSPGTYQFDPDLLLSFSMAHSGSERLFFSEESLNASGGCIGARSKHNVVATKPTSTIQKMEVDKDSQGRWQVRNELGFGVRSFFTKIDGQLYCAFDVQDEAEVKLEKVESQQLDALVQDCVAVEENCFSEDVSVATPVRYSGRYGYQKGREIVAVPSRDPNGKMISEWGMVGVHLGMLGGKAGRGTRPPNVRAQGYLNELEDRQYVAICNDSPFAVTLKKSTSYEYQMHVIHGKW